MLKILYCIKEKINHLMTMLNISFLQIQIHACLIDPYYLSFFTFLNMTKAKKYHHRKSRNEILGQSRFLVRRYSQFPRNTYLYHTHFLLVEERFMTIQFCTAYIQSYYLTTNLLLDKIQSYYFIRFRAFITCRYKLHLVRKYVFYFFNLFQITIFPLS